VAEREFYSQRELAELLRVNVVTVRRLVKRGEIPFHRIGRVLRFRRKDVESYLARVREVSE